MDQAQPQAEHRLNLANGLMHKLVGLEPLTIVVALKIAEEFEQLVGDDGLGHRFGSVNS